VCQRETSPTKISSIMLRCGWRKQEPNGGIRYHYLEGKDSQPALPQCPQPESFPFPRRGVSPKVTALPAEHLRFGALFHPFLVLESAHKFWHIRFNVYNFQKCTAPLKALTYIPPKFQATEFLRVTLNMEHVKYLGLCWMRPSCNHQRNILK
jgi:hypothetical protein